MRPSKRDHDTRHQWARPEGGTAGVCIVHGRLLWSVESLLLGNADHISYGAAMEKSLSKILYFIGSAEATMEVVALGSVVQKVSVRCSVLKGKVVKVENVMWDCKHGVLKHGRAILVQATDECEEHVAGVDFQFCTCHVSATVTVWTCISLRRRIFNLDSPQPSERRTGQSFCEFLLLKEGGQAVQVKRQERR